MQRGAGSTPSTSYTAAVARRAQRWAIFCERYWTPGRPGQNVWRQIYANLYQREREVARDVAGKLSQSNVGTAEILRDQMILGIAACLSIKREPASVILGKTIHGRPSSSKP